MNAPTQEAIQPIQAPIVPLLGASVIYSITLANGFVVTSPEGFAEIPVSSGDRMGFSLQRLIEGEQSAEAGRVRQLVAVLDELRSRNRE